jgi:environmental stress-induced protein Ves
MQTHIIKDNDCTTISWANGTSTERYISPANGNFQTRDFNFRISTATVASPTSTFTFFEGITRHLMLLKGELTLLHKNRYSKQLVAYEQDTFFGEWETESIGMVTDFNLMLKNGYQGQLTHQHLEVSQTIQLSHNAQFKAIFVAEGELIIGDQRATMGDLIILESLTEYSLNTNCDTHFIIITVNEPCQTN